LTQKTVRQYKEIITSRYAHLFLGLLVLYGIYSIVTHTTSFDKITENLKRYCYADYEMKMPRNPLNIREIKYYREKFKERVDALTKGAFDHDRKDEAQSYFMNYEFLYDSCRENGNPSYLLARIVEKGVTKREIPEEVRFDYFILGEKTIVPFPEYEKGPGARTFVSPGENAIYLYRDSLEPILRWYFESLWITQPKQSYQFYGDALSYSLYRDLQGTCEAMFLKEHPKNRRSAEESFVEEGFKTFLPTMLSMGARMAADRKSKFPSDYQYLRACLTGLSLDPNHTMFYLLKTGTLYTYTPMARKGWNLFLQRLDPTYPDQITLQKISETSQDILNRLKVPP